MSLTRPWHPDLRDERIAESLANLVRSTSTDKLQFYKAQLLDRMHQFPHGFNAAVARLSDLLLPVGGSGCTATLEDLNSVIGSMIAYLPLFYGTRVASGKSNVHEPVEDSTDRIKDVATHSGNKSGTPSGVFIPANEPRLVELYRLLHFGSRQALYLAQTESTSPTFKKTMERLESEAHTLRDGLRDTILHGRFTGLLNRLSFHYLFCDAVAEGIIYLQNTTEVVKKDDKGNLKKYKLEVLEVVEDLAIVVVRKSFIDQWKLHLITDAVHALSGTLKALGSPSMNNAVVQTLTLAQHPELRDVTRTVIPNGGQFEEEPTLEENEPQDRFAKASFLPRSNPYLFGSP